MKPRLDIDLSSQKALKGDIDTWKNDPYLILETARRYTRKWGRPYSDKEDLQMYITEIILKSLDKYDSNRGMNANSYIYKVSRRAVWDYGRKFGEYYRGRGDKQVVVQGIEYHEIDIDDLAEDRGMRVLNQVRLRYSHVDKHENFDFIQYLKKFDQAMKKIIFYFYFLEMKCSEIAKELGVSEGRIWQQLINFRNRYQKDHLVNDNTKFSSSSLEDSPIEKLEDFYKLIQKQSRLTQDLSYAS